MPLVINQNISTNSLLKIWHINEHIDDIFFKTYLTKDEKIFFRNITNESRRLQWLICRMLIKDEINPETEVLYRINRQPYLSDSSIHISISHTKAYAAVIFSTEKLRGLDIEMCSNRLIRIKDKMSSIKELQSVRKEFEIEDLTTIWCAKEALFKKYGACIINFKDDIYIDLENTSDTGLIKAHLNNRDTVQLQKLRHDNHIIVYTI